MRIFYRVPEFDQPSWGVALLYAHVEMLRALGHDAYVVGPESAPAWFDSTAPAVPLDQALADATDHDLWVVPEVLVNAFELEHRRGLKVVFVQGAFLVVSGLGIHRDYRALHYHGALTILPSLKDVVASHFGLDPHLVPPFVDDSFFASPCDQPRERVVLLSAKDAYAAAGLPDREIFDHVAVPELAKLGWRVEVLENLDHQSVQERMARASILVNLNPLEAFNTTVPEALASGCIVFCYEGFGGQDFLDDENAFVYPNGYVFPLITKLTAVVQGLDQAGSEISTVARRRAARESVQRFRREQCKDALARAFEVLL